MPEDFLDLWNTKELSLTFETGWMEQGPWYDRLSDRDLFALWCAMSV